MPVGKKDSSTAGAVSAGTGDSAARQHTPGPWCISTDGTLPIRVKAPDAVVWKDHQTIVAHVGDSQYAPVDFKESVANARLIAAAPEMLEALKEILKCRSEYEAIKRTGVASALLFDHERSLAMRSKAAFSKAEAIISAISKATS